MRVRMRIGVIHPIPVNRRSSSDEETDDEPSGNSKGDDAKDLEDDGDVKDGKDKDPKDKKESTHKLLTRSSRTAQLLRLVPAFGLY